MTDVLKSDNTNNRIMYTFRFSASNELVRLNQEQLDLIPYLSALVDHENDEYLLNPPLLYKQFIPILHSVTSKTPYILFNELPEDENIMETIQLCDYLDVHLISTPLLDDKDLCLPPFLDAEDLISSFHLNAEDLISSFHLNAEDLLSSFLLEDKDLFLPPLLETEDVFLSDGTYEKGHIKYHPTNLSEARNTAAQFIISISKNEYDLYEINTLQFVYDLLVIIFSNKDVFSSRFRHHTLTIIKECCLTFFSAEQLFELPKIEDIAQNRIMDSWIYLYEDDQPLSETFQNSIARKGVHKFTEENDTDISSHFVKPISWTPSRKFTPRLMQPISWIPSIELTPYLIKPKNRCVVDYTILNNTRPRLSEFLRLLMNEYEQYNYSFDDGITLTNKNRCAEEKYISEARSARSGRFNTLPKRPTVDKFKYRFGPKVLNYR